MRGLLLLSLTRLQFCCGADFYHPTKLLGSAGSSNCPLACSVRRRGHKELRAAKRAESSPARGTDALRISAPKPGGALRARGELTACLGPFTVQPNKQTDGSIGAEAIPAMRLVMPRRAPMDVPQCPQRS
jgi:hypothetical protein